MGWFKKWLEGPDKKDDLPAPTSSPMIIERVEIPKVKEPGSLRKRLRLLMAKAVKTSCTCEVCGEPLVVNSQYQVVKYCSNQCRKIRHNRNANPAHKN